MGTNNYKKFVEIFSRNGDIHILASYFTYLYIEQDDCKIGDVAKKDIEHSPLSKDFFLSHIANINKRYWEYEHPLYYDFPNVIEEIKEKMLFLPNKDAKEIYVQGILKDFHDIYEILITHIFTHPDYALIRELAFDALYEEDKYIQTFSYLGIGLWHYWQFTHNLYAICLQNEIDLDDLQERLDLWIADSDWCSEEYVAQILGSETALHTLYDKATIPTLSQGSFSHLNPSVLYEADATTQKPIYQYLYSQKSEAIIAPTNDKEKHIGQSISFLNFRENFNLPFTNGKYDVIPDKNGMKKEYTRFELLHDFIESQLSKENDGKKIAKVAYYIFDSGYLKAKRFKSFNQWRDYFYKYIGRGKTPYKPKDLRGDSEYKKLFNYLND